ncbi:lipopolysaccharide biosynthesis protein [Chloroflexota bacterium]
MTARDTQLSRGALFLLMGQGVFLLTGYVLHAVLARWLTPALYGVFGVTMTVLVWAEITVNNGVAPALQKFLPDRTVCESSVRRSAVRVQALISVGIFLLLFLFAPLLAKLLRDPSLTGYLRLAFVDILAMGAYAYYRGVLNGWRVFRQLASIIAVYSVTKLAAICLLVYLGFGVEGALVGNVMASLGGLVAGFFWVRRDRSRSQVRRQVDPGQEEGHGALKQIDELQILAFALPTVLFTLASNVLLGLDLMGVKALIGDADQVGYYSAAVKLAEAPRLILLAFSFALLPSLAHAITAKDHAQTRHYLQQAIRLLAMVLFPILALVLATAGSLIEFVFSAAYAPAAEILRILIFAYAAYTLYITLVTALLAENRPGRALAIPAVLLPVAMGLVWWGIGRFGAQGAALASLVSVSCAALVVVVYVFRRFRPAVDLISVARIGLASIVLWAVARWWAPSGLLLIVAYGLLGGLYLALLLAFREVRPQEVTLVRTWFIPSNKK